MPDAPRFASCYPDDAFAASAASGVATLVSLSPDDNGERPRSEIPTAEDLSGSGRYREIKQLAKGANGIVVLSFDLRLRRFVIIKVVPGNEGKQLKLFEEAEALAQLSHPNVVQVYDIDNVKPAGISMVIEYVEGESLAKWMETPRSWQECVEVFTQAGKGLLAVHREGIIHRDFKPANVMIGEDKVKVVDFGLASYQEELNRASLAGTASDSSSPSQTRLEKIEGTPAYMSPEQIRNESLDARTDQFSFCVALFEAVYGQRPFAGDNPAEVQFNISDGNMIDIPKDVKVPKALRRIILKGLSPNPDDRYASMAELLADLKALLVPKRRRAVGFVLGISVGAAAMTLQESPVEDCRDKGWEVMQGALEALESPPEMNVELDAFVHRWMQEYDRVCRMENEKTRKRLLGCLEVQAGGFGLSVNGNVNSPSNIVMPNLKECFEVN